MKVELEVEEEQRMIQSRPSLAKFIRDDRDLYEAMEFFLLGSPKRQIMQDGGQASLKKTADEAKISGDKLAARINYESAAKVALYEQDAAGFKDMLELAEGVTSEDDKFGRFHRALLLDVDETMRVAREYYAELEAVPSRVNPVGEVQSTP
jgi:hypothetical protein